MGGQKRLRSRCCSDRAVHYGFRVSSAWRESSQDYTLPYATPSHFWKDECSGMSSCCSRFDAQHDNLVEELRRFLCGRQATCSGRAAVESWQMQKQHGFLEN